LPNINVIVFDTFGTVVDWRGSIVGDLTAWGKWQAIQAEWALLANLWRCRVKLGP
jgi:2-haloacid dehalogenase